MPAHLTQPMQRPQLNIIGKMEQMTVARLEKSLFTTSKPDENLHRCAVALDRRHVVSFRHGAPSFLEKEEKSFCTMLWTLVTVIATSEKHDLIIFKTVNQEFTHYPFHVGSVYPCKRYFQLGICQKREAIWKEGIISKLCPNYCLGTSHGAFGDSGSGIFCTNGHFMGISVAKKQFAFTNSQLSINEVADHHPETKIISFDIISRYLNGDDVESCSPAKKCAE